jgi:hypothetical protein
MGLGSPRWAAALLLILAAVESCSAAPASTEACRVPAAAEAVLRAPGTCSALDRRHGDPVGVIEVSYPDALIKIIAANKLLPR